MARTKLSFLKDVLIAALASYGGPEAHYGIFSSYLVEKKGYLSEEELTEMIGLYSLVPGPSSTQTITAIGYHVGGPWLALLTFLVWAFPAILIMALFAVFFTRINSNESWQPLLQYLPLVATAFILYAAVNLSRKVLKSREDGVLWGIMIILSYLLKGKSMWVVPLLLLSGGLISMLWERHRAGEQTKLAEGLPEKSEALRPQWLILGIVIGIALLNELLRVFFPSAWMTLYTSFYRYGYSVIGGGQIVIPLMIEDLVRAESLISMQDFLAGYAIDQAVPGPLFSFAAFVSARSIPGVLSSLLAGVMGGLSIFLPGLLLVYFMHPLWKKTRGQAKVKDFLKGVSVTAASLIVVTALTQVLQLEPSIVNILILGLSTLTLLKKWIPAPFLVFIAAGLGFLV